jgi:hypothetical protein
LLLVTNEVGDWGDEASPALSRSLFNVECLLNDFYLL